MDIRDQRTVKDKLDKMRDLQLDRARLLTALKYRWPDWPDEVLPRILIDYLPFEE